ADLRSFHQNGDADARMAMNAGITFDSQMKPHATGNGGEIFRGAYYGGLGRRLTTTNGCEIVHGILSRRGRIQSMSFEDAEIGPLVGERLSNLLVELARLSTNPYDLMDMYYVFQRFGVWG